jgi:translation initiation factor 4E
VQDESNRSGGQWTLRLKKGLANRYWEDLILAIVGDQVREATPRPLGDLALRF